jgi:hypothetical protein
LNAFSCLYRELLAFSLAKIWRGLVLVLYECTVLISASEVLSFGRREEKKNELNAHIYSLSFSLSLPERTKTSATIVVSLQLSTVLISALEVLSLGRREEKKKEEEEIDEG